MGFGVGVAIGLAPYLGAIDLPLFAPLLDLIPESVRHTAIPLSAALMGVLAVAVQWYAGDKLPARRLGRWFRRSLVWALASFLALLVVHTMLVVVVPVLGGEKSVSFVVGFTRPQRAPCGPEVSDSECIKLLSLNPSGVTSFWGDRQVRLAGLILVLSYLAFTASFGALVGTLLLRNAETKRR